MAELPPGYRNVPPEDRKKAQVFFDRGKTVAEAGQYDYAIDMYIEGLNIDPDALEAHQQLRNISLQRKAMGGKAMGMLQRMKIGYNAKEQYKQNMLNAERLLAFDPGNTDYMLGVLENAHRAGFYDTAMWMGPILFRANSDTKSPEAKKFLALKDVYKDLRQWKLATEACQAAARYDENMDLQQEIKNLGAMETMDSGNYQTGGSFRDSLQNKDAQHRLMEDSRDHKTEDVLVRRLKEAAAEYKAEKHVEGKVIKYVEALEATEDLENENMAIEVLEEAFKRTRQFRFRERLGRIKMKQMGRMERSLRQVLQESPKDESLRKDYDAFKREQLEFELSEITLWAENYPSVLSHKYDMATRLFALGRQDEAIPLLQQSRSDPKLKTDSTVMLGRAFLASGYVDEAIETLEGVIQEYQLKGDDRSKEMHYWQGRAFEEKGAKEQAQKRYSQVAQMEFTYKDVQQRIKALRAK